MAKKPLWTLPGSDDPEPTPPPVAKVETVAVTPAAPPAAIAPKVEDVPVEVEEVAADTAPRLSAEDELVVFSTRIPRKLAMELSEVAHASRWTRKRVTISELVTDAVEVYLRKLRPRDAEQRKEGATWTR